MTPLSRDELPPAIQGLCAWYGPDLAARADWIERLSDTEDSEIDRASQRLADAEMDSPSIRQQDFPLPTLGPRLRRILAELLTGRGFVLLRRLPVERWSRREAATAFFGLGARLAAGGQAGR